jgi:hypothetical protein
MAKIFLLVFLLFSHPPTPFQTAKKKTVSNGSNGRFFSVGNPFEARLKIRLEILVIRFKTVLRFG